MVGKLFKHEIKSYLMKLFPAQLVLLLIAAVNRFIQLFESDSNAYAITFGSATFLYVIAILVLAVITIVTVINRFYKNMFTSEGYLTLTLPVTVNQHIFVKLTVAFIFTVITGIAIFLSFCIATLGDVLVEIFKAAGYILNKYLILVSPHGGWYILEVILIALTSIIVTYLLYYTCMAIGQLAKKHRVAWSFGVFFIYYIAMQILSTIFMIVTYALEDSPLFNFIGDFITKYPFASVHISMITMIVSNIILSLVYYLITHFIIKKKLNLE